jgi:hypothetical protein
MSSRDCLTMEALLAVGRRPAQSSEVQKSTVSDDR